ncbi:hypothetical protein COOONC_17009, partial [Cooperia oncophora]
LIKVYFLPTGDRATDPNDIGIVQLYIPAVEKGVWPICLPSEQDQLFKGEKPRVAGWGIHPEHNGDVMLHKLTYARNQSSYENEMYVMRGGTRAVCRGDSGAGLYRVDEGDSRATVLGVLSGMELLMLSG